MVIYRFIYTIMSGRFWPSWLFEVRRHTFSGYTVEIAGCQLQKTEKFNCVIVWFQNKC